MIDENMVEGVRGALTANPDFTGTALIFLLGVLFLRFAPGIAERGSSSVDSGKSINVMGFITVAAIVVIVILAAGV